jgi:hypothetical protein
MSKSARAYSENARQRIRSTFFVLLGIACGVPGAVVAQTQFEIAPYVGLYRPTSILGSGAGVTLKHQGSSTLGMRVTLWGPGRLAIEGTLGSAPSRLWSSQSGFAYPAHVLTVSAKALLQVTSPAARAALHVGGGVGLVGHGGDAYPPWYVGPTTFLSGIANVGASIRLTRWMVVRFDVEDFVYSAHVGDCTRTGASQRGACDIWDTAVLTRPPITATPTSSVVQNDLVLSLGFALRP